MLCAGTLTISIVTSATSLQVFDMLEGRCELVVDKNVVDNQMELQWELP